MSNKSFLSAGSIYVLITLPTFTRVFCYPIVTKNFIFFLFRLLMGINGYYTYV